MGTPEIKLTYYNDETYWEDYAFTVNAQEIRTVVREEYMDFRGIRIHLDIYAKDIAPEAPTLVWCPGTAIYCRFYVEFLLRMWRRGYRVVCVDQYGHGKSGGSRGHFTLPLLVDVMKAAITYSREHLGATGKFFVGGSSLGGFTAFYTGEMDKDRVAASVCHNILYGGQFDPNAMFRLRGVLKMALKLISVAVKILPKFRLSVWNYLQPEELIDQSNEKSRKLIDKVLADPVLSARYSVTALHSQIKWHPPVPLEQFTTPCLLLQGANDAIFPLTMEQSLFARVGAPKEMALMEGGSHMVILEQAEKCAEIVDDWLQKIQ